jgi:hypothetical protein
MATVKVNGVLNALVHKGAGWFSMATVPDFCKTPTPGGPVPMPYPNISEASSLSDGTTTVKVDGGNMAAIKGSKFATSSGDEPGSVGGVKSNTFKQASTWILYSFDVKLEGKNACRFSDKKFQNNENTVDATGVLPIVVNVALIEVKMECGELGQYKEQKKVRKGGKRARDHIPSKQALKERAKKLKGGGKKKVRLNKCEVKMIDDHALTIVTPTAAHQRTRTYGQSRSLASADADDLAGAANNDLKRMEGPDGVKKSDKNCEKAYADSAEKIRAITNDDYDKWLTSIIQKCKS